MRTEIIFKDFSRSEYIENFIQNKVETLANRLISPDNDTHISVRLIEAKERTAVRRPIYQCEMTIKSGMSPKTYKIHKEDRNIFRAIIFCADAAKVALAKSHDRLRNDRRRRKTPELNTSRELDLEEKES